MVNAWIYEPARSAFGFEKFFAATDAILDAQHALFAAERHKWPQDSSEKSLWLYGALQALAIERDGVAAVLECFGVDPTAFRNDTRYANEIRVRVAGHPSNHRRKHLAVKGVTFVSRLPRDGGQFVIGTYPDEGQYLSTELDVVELIKRQSLSANKALSAVWQLVKPDWQKHRDSLK
ncbi:MAG: hypothetical protein WD036_01965 [Bauldia sp.]